MFATRFRHLIRACLLGAMFSAATGAIPAPSGEAWRKLKDPSGRDGVEARFEGIRDGRYLLRRRNDGKLFEVAPDMLTGDDRAWLDASSAKLNEQVGKLNAACGHPLFSGTPFEVRDAGEIASALDLRKESECRHSRSWRSYHRDGDGYRLFGAMPYSVALYADGPGKATSMSVVYANKGDFRNTAKSSEDHFDGESKSSIDALNKAMDADHGALEAALKSVLGEPKIQRFGEGKSRRTVQRWDWNGHSLLLSQEPDEYVSLLVVPGEFAAAGGRTALTKDAVMRERLKTDVRREPNGDVYLGEVPMVDQGPKGYCVPATFERAMRVMGVDADMYLLAMAGGTAMGGGTSVDKLLGAVRSQVYSKARRTRDIKARELRVRDVKPFIDQGVPVMWTMMAMGEYSKAASEDTALRKSVSNWEEHAKWVADKAAPFAKKEKPSDRHHMCMIVGYNEATNELAVSDSWGPEFERRWVPVKIADWASLGGLFLILP